MGTVRYTDGQIARSRDPVTGTAMGTARYTDGQIARSTDPDRGTLRSPDRCSLILPWGGSMRPRGTPKGSDRYPSIDQTGPRDPLISPGERGSGIPQSGEMG